MKAYGENEGRAPIILDAGTRWTWVVGQLFEPTALFPEIELSVSNKEEAGWAPDQSGSSEEHRTLLSLPGGRPVSLDDPPPHSSHVLPFRRT
jgi:hypothetical protein